MIKFEKDNIIVIDDFLSTDDFAEMQQEAMQHEFELIPHGADIAYKLNTGDIYKTTRKYWSDAPEKFHKFFAAIKSANVVDAEKHSLMIHAYRAGAEIDWHIDYSSLASYSFYIHPEWQPNWGGNLLVSDHNTLDTKQHNGNVFDTNTNVMNPGFGTYYAPLPNRLVIIKKVFHKVERVDLAAGSNTRMSFTGFFK